MSQTPKNPKTMLPNGRFFKEAPFDETSPGERLPRWNTPCTEEEVVQRLKETPTAYQNYLSMRPDWKTRFLDFCTGKKTLPLTYDPFFKTIFHPDIHPGRLSHFLSSLLGMSVKVKSVLPSEDILMTEGTLLIMDIIVELEGGSLANVEIQKIPYTMPGERMSCYSADLLLRQYSRLKDIGGKDFAYHDMKKVYTIVLYEQSIQAFHDLPEEYIHYGKTTFNTDLRIEFLQEYCLVALDVFREIMYPEGKIKTETQTDAVNKTETELELESWLLLLTTETVEEAEELIKRYPWMEKIYQETVMYRQKPEEVLLMYSEALRELDRNEARYMIEEMTAQLEAQSEALKEKDAALEEKDAVLEATLKEKDAELKEKDATMKAALDAKDAELEALRRELEKLQKSK